MLFYKKGHRKPASKKQKNLTISGKVSNQIINVLEVNNHEIPAFAGMTNLKSLIVIR